MAHKSPAEIHVFLNIGPGERGGMGEYQRRIAIFGPGEREGTFDAWCYVYDAVRTYRCDRVVKLEELDTGKSVTGNEVMRILCPRCWMINEALVRLDRTA